MLRQALQHIGDQVALGVDDHPTPAVLGIGQDHPRQHGGFPAAGGAEHVHVVPGVGDLEPDRAGVPGIGNPDGPDQLTLGGRIRRGGTAFALARARPGRASSVGRCASAASSGTDSRSPRRNRRRAMAVSGLRSRRRW